MKTANTMLPILMAAGLFVMTVNASPAMAPAAEASSETSVNLNIMNRAGAVAAVAVGFDLFGFMAAWSEAVPLKTTPFIGTLIFVR